MPVQQLVERARRKWLRDDRMEAVLGRSVHEPGDRIEVRTFEDGSSVVVEVADTGPGIPADELPHVWEELFRGNGARGVQGSGLGMALVRAIIERHGGSLALRSRVDQGTVVTARLPLGSGTNLP